MPPLSVFLQGEHLTPSQLFKEAVAQVSQHLPRCQSCVATSRTLADYFTRDVPEISGLPFGVALAHATFLYHLKLNRPSTSDLENILGLLTTIVSIASEQDVTNSYFFEEVVRGALLGLPPSRRRAHIQRRSGQLLTVVPHYVVLLPSNIVESFTFIACNLVVSPRLVHLRDEFLGAIQGFSQAPAVLVSLRSRLIQLRCSPRSAREHAAEVIQIVAQGPEALPSEAVALVYDHLRFAVNFNEAERTVEEHALCIGSSRVLLELQSPVRRAFVENYLYPALRDPRMEPKLRKPETSAHLGQQLLRLMCPGNPQCPYYLCCCALFFRMLCDTPVRGARFLVVLCQLVMPEGAQFVALLSSDSQMDSDYFAQTISFIVEGMIQTINYINNNNNNNNDDDDDAQNNNNNNNNQQYRQRPPFENGSVASLIFQGGPSLLIKIIFMLRLIVSSIVHSPAEAVGAFGFGRNNNSNNNNQQAHRRELFLRELRTSLTRDTLEHISAFIEDLNNNNNNNQNGGGDTGSLAPHVLVTEMGMMLHGLYIDSTLEGVREFVGQQLDDKQSAAGTDAAFIARQNRLILALSECAAARHHVATQAATWLRHDPLDPVTHVTLLAVMSRCAGTTHRTEMFDIVCSSLIANVLPAVRSNLIAPEAEQERRMRDARIQDCEGASSALIFVTRLLLMIRNGGGSGFGAGSSNDVSPLARRLCTDLALIAASLGRSLVRSQVGLVLWWSSLSLLRFGGEKSSIAITSQILSVNNNNDNANNNNNNNNNAMRGISGSGSRRQSVASSSAGAAIPSNSNHHHQQRAYSHLFATLRHVHMHFPKLVGIAVSRLIQDFCLHAPIIVENLVSVLDEHYEMNRNHNNNNTNNNQDQQHQIEEVAQRRAEHFGIVLKNDSPFKLWLSRQIATSVPSRTALIIAFTQCIASRVRVHPRPHQLLVLHNNNQQQEQQQGNNNTNNTNRQQQMSQLEESLQLALARERTFSDLLLKALQGSMRVGEAFCNTACAWIRGDACPKMTTPGPFMMVIGALLALRHGCPARSRNKIQESINSQLPKIAIVADTLVRQYQEELQQQQQQGGMTMMMMMNNNSPRLSPAFVQFASTLAAVSRGEVVVEEDEQEAEAEYHFDHHHQQQNNNLAHEYRNNFAEDVDDDNNDGAFHDDDDDDNINNNNLPLNSQHVQQELYMMQQQHQHGDGEDFNHTASNTSYQMMNDTELNFSQQSLHNNQQYQNQNQQQQQPFINEVNHQQQQQQRGHNNNNYNNSNQHSTVAMTSAPAGAMRDAQPQQPQPRHPIYSRSAFPLQQPARQNQQQQQIIPRRAGSSSTHNTANNDNTLPQQQGQHQQVSRNNENNHNNNNNHMSNDEITWNILRNQNCSSVLLELQAGLGNSPNEMASPLQQQQHQMMNVFGLNNNNMNMATPFTQTFANAQQQQQQQQNQQQQNQQVNQQQLQQQNGLWGLGGLGDSDTRSLWQDVRNGILFNNNSNNNGRRERQSFNLI